jgi:hypothetical protein
MGRKALNLKNKRFKKLVAIKIASSNRNGNIVWICRCDCGNYATYSTDHLTRKDNPVKSCGCNRKLRGPQHKDWKGYGEISGKWWALHVARERMQVKRKKI